MSVPPTNKSAFSFPDLSVGQGAAASSQTTNIQDPHKSFQASSTNNTINAQTKLIKVVARPPRDTSPQNRFLQVPTQQIGPKNKAPEKQLARTQSAAFPTIFGAGAGAGAAGSGVAGMGASVVAESAGAASEPKNWDKVERKADGKSLPKIGDKDSSPSKPTSAILKKYSPEDDTSENLTSKNGRSISSVSMRQTVTTVNHFMELATTHFYQDDLLEAIKYIDKCLVCNPKYVPALLLKVSILMNGLEYNTALPIIEQILKIDSNNINALKFRGIAYFYKNNYTEAAKNFEFLIREVKNYENPVVFDLLGRIYRAEKRLKENEFFYENILQLSPKNLYILKELVQRLIKLGRLYEAIANLTVILQEKETDYIALITRANLYYKLEEYDKAKEDANTLLKFYPSDKSAKNILVAVDLKMKRLKGLI